MKLEFDNIEEFQIFIEDYVRIHILSKEQGDSTNVIEKKTDLGMARFLLRNYKEIFKTSATIPKLAIIKQVRSIANLGLKEAKELVDNYI